MTSASTEAAVELAPYALVRLAALPHPAPPADAAPFRAAVNELVADESALASMARDLVEELHDSAAAHSPEFHRAVVLPLRRDVHNGRTPRPALLAALDTLPLRIPLLARWLAARAELTATTGVVLERWAQALAAERAVLAELCAAEPLRRACVLTGRDLLHGVDRTAAGRGAPNRKARKAEPTVLRYALRATSKTSPLSWYTYVGWGTWTPDAPEPAPTGDPVSRTGVNRLLLTRFTATLPREALSYRLAPALRERAGRVLFRRDVPVDTAMRAHLTQEEEVDLPATAPLRFVLASVGAGIGLAQLANALAERLPEDQAPAARGYVDKMVHIGLLVPVAPVDPQDLDAVGALAEWLRTNAEPGLADRLAAVDADTQAFATADPPTRSTILANLQDSWRELGVDPTGVSPLGEDVVLRDPLPLNDKGTAALSRLTPLLMMFDQQLLLRRLIRDHFVARFGTGAVAHPADCTVALSAAWLDAMNIAAAATRSREVDELLASRAALAALVEPDGTITERVVDLALNLLPGWLRGRPASYSIFVQPDDAGLVVNHVYTGFGKFTSRFLDQLPAAAHTAVADQLRRVLGEFTQFRPVGGFSANLHPLLTKQEIGEDCDLTADDLELHHDPAADEVRLRHKATGEPLDVLYLGFLVPLALPDRLIALYSDLACGWLDLDPLRSTEVDGAATIKGRLSYRDVVLCRKSWDFAALDLGTEEQTALAATRLRARYGLPEHVFVGTPSQLSSTKDFERLLTSGKPQYVDLGNALHLRCLPRLLTKFPDGPQLTEALPVPRGRVVEFVAETYWRVS
jgi:hypothetical protein